MSDHVEFCRKFCAELKGQADLTGEVNEDALKPLVSKLLKDFASLNNIDGLKTTTEQHLSDLKVRPDISVYIRGLIYGHIELKNPRVSVDVRTFKSHDKQQWDRLSNLPNLLYTNGREWRLYRWGKLEGDAIEFAADPRLEGSAAVDAEIARKLGDRLSDFLQWQPCTPHEPSDLAEHLALLAQTLRREAEVALQQKNSKVLQLQRELAEFCIPDIKGEDVADIIAQTVTYSLLLACLEGGRNLSLEKAIKKLQEKNKLLAELLKLFDQAKEELKTGFALLQRSLEALDVVKFSKTSAKPSDTTSGMGVYFYEHFLRAYDSEMSKNAGIYYTPKEVVALQTRLASGILEEHFNKVEGFASEGVVLLDPAVGTGAYLIEALHQGMGTIEKRFGKVQVPAYSEQMMKNMHGIELLVGPYIVAHVQLSKAFKEYQDEHVKGSDIRPNIYLGDTLSNPYRTSSMPLLHYQILSDENERVQRIKTEGEVLVCLGNPPYDRQNVEQDDKSEYRKGGWVRYGDGKKGQKKTEMPIFEDFLRPAKDAGKGIHLKNLYNDYVYFWRWALWRLFEQQKNGGIISFITASSYLRGDAFVGMREVMRQTFDELWILDLEGDSIGARKSANVFAIRTPVAIAIGYRGKKSQPEKPARVRYVKIPGETRREKLWVLEKINRLGENKVFSTRGQKKLGKELSSLTLEWSDCPQNWQAPFLPIETGEFFEWPALNDLFPWHHSGCQFKRTWPIGETKELLEDRWQTLLDAPVERRAELFKETGDRKITYTTEMDLPGGNELSIKELDNSATPPPPPSCNLIPFAVSTINTL